MRSEEIILRPVISEKSTKLREKENKYVFVVAKDANNPKNIHIKHFAKYFEKLNLSSSYIVYSIQLPPFNLILTQFLILFTS